MKYLSIYIQTPLSVYRVHHVSHVSHVCVTCKCNLKRVYL